MNTKRFKAMVVNETKEKQFVRTIQDRHVEDLPDGDVLVAVHYSSLNFKDALSATGNRGVTREYPHTPGIDAAGVVVESRSDRIQPGDEVIVTSYDLGMNTDGGFGQYIRVPAGWVVKRPAALSMRESMILGTAGFTAGMCVERLVQGGVTPDKGDVLVTGATGGVGCLATAILAKLGYAVVGVSGKPEAESFLKGLGAKSVMSRQEAVDTSKRPLLKGIWAGVVDTVGGDILATALKSSDHWAVVTCCGLVASPQLPTTVFPFIIRGVTLVGINSQTYPQAPRRKVWEHLATDWKVDGGADLVTEVSLEALDPHIELILKGQQRGRVVVNLQD